MIADTDLELLADLAPVHDAELAGSAQEPEAQALLARIVAEPSSRPRRREPRRLRRRLLLAPVAAAIAAAAVAAMLISSTGSGTTNAAAATLNRVAAVASHQALAAPGPGQYLYTKSVDAYEEGENPTTGQSYNVLVPHVRQIWLGPSGGRLYETSGTPTFLTAQDRAQWVAAGSPSLKQPVDTSRLSPTQPLDLPSDPDALWTVLAHEAEGNSNGLYPEMFTEVGDALRETSATPAQRAALYQVAARIPGVKVLGPTQDTAGRTGTGVALDGPGAIRTVLIFDPDTSVLLGEEGIALAGNTFGYSTGERIWYSTYVVQKVVDSDHSTS